MKKMKNPTKRTQIAIFTAIVMFVITFFLHFVISTLSKAPDGKISDWMFISGQNVKDITGNIDSYKQSSSENPVSTEFGKRYIRLHYVLPSSSYDKRLTIKTDYNPVRIEINGEEVWNNGFNEGNFFTGSCYQSVKINGNVNETEVDIFLYAPLAFNIEGVVSSEEPTVSELFGRYIGFGAAIALILTGIVLFLLSVFMASKSKSIKRMLLLSLTVLCGGAVGCIYSLSRTTSLLLSPHWFAGLLVGQLVLMVLAFVTVLSCCNKALKNAIIFIPVIIICAIIPVFQTAWAIRIVAVAVAVSEFYIALRALKAFSTASGSDVPQVGVVQGVLLYTTMIGVYNSICLLLGINMMSTYLYGYGIALMCLVIFVVYCRQIIFLDIKKYERIVQIYKDSTWIEGITDLISRMFMQKDEISFLTEIAQSLSAIIEKNAEGDESLNVHSCVGVLNDGKFSEIYNDGDLQNCDYNEIAMHLRESENHLLIGNTTVDMLFSSERSLAVIHFENILSGLYGNIGNIIKAAYSNLNTAFQNLNLKKDMSSLQVELIIHLAQVVEKRSSLTNQHQLAVSAMVYELCRELGMKEDRSQLISMAAMTHDIGKIAISESILEKQGKLSDEESMIMKLHTDYGYNVLSLQTGEFFDIAAKIAKQHHENFDGTGYHGMKGREIDPGARIVHVIDVFEALLSERPYKEKWDANRAVGYITENRGILFDPAVTDAFIHCAQRLIDLRNTVYNENSDTDVRVK